VSGQNDGDSSPIIGIVEGRNLRERSKYTLRHRTGRCKVEVDDFNNPTIAETMQYQCTTLKQDGRFLRAQKVPAKIDSRGIPVGSTMGITEAYGKFWDTPLIAPMTQ
jgi:hypothetical protein